MTRQRSVPVRVGGRRLTAVQVAAVARHHAPVDLVASARRAIRASKDALDRRRSTPGGGRLYGVDTGVGALDQATAEVESSGLALLRSHAAGVGPPLEPELVRAMILVRLSQLSRGRSGIREDLADRLIALLHRGLTPMVPSWGSVGSSDLAPLAHVGLALAGEGLAMLDGEVLEGGCALERAQLTAHSFDAREALGLMNGSALVAGSAALSCVDLRRVLDAWEVAAGLGAAALRSPSTTWEARALDAKQVDAAAACGRRLRVLAGFEDGAPLVSTVVAREPLSGRYAPHVLGAAREALAHLVAVTEGELTAAVDNPMIDADGWTTSNAGNSDTTRLTLALDHAADAIAAVATASERRLCRLLSCDDLPAFLRHPEAPATQSGLMMVQYTAAALVAEIGGLSGGAATRSRSVSAQTEDYNAMGASAAARLRRTVELSSYVVAAELLCAAQALELRGIARRDRSLRAQAHRVIRSAVAPLREDRSSTPDLEALRWAILQGRFDRLSVAVERAAAGAPLSPVRRRSRVRQSLPGSRRSRSAMRS